MSKSPIIKSIHFRNESNKVCSEERVSRACVRRRLFGQDSMDKKFGAPWNVVLGQYYSFEITAEVKHLLYLFVQGSTAVLVWKSQ